MGNLEQIGRWILIGGVVLVCIGGFIWLIAIFTGWQEFPGTLKINLPGMTCVFPLLASIVLSVVLTVILNLLGRWLNH